jgi:hypothetical protein
MNDGDADSAWGDGDDRSDDAARGRRGGREMVSRARIRAALDAADPELRACLSLVASMWRGEAGEDVGRDILGFQLRLLDAIEGLERPYRAIRREEKRLIGRKPLLQRGWFSRRMAILASYRRMLAEALALARAIGDAFAWMFYQRDRDLLADHLKLQPQRLLPPDLGALGERLTLERMQGLDGRLLIYHGTTSILRIGDFSLVDLRSGRVSCVGELKTARTDAETVTVSVMLVSGDPQALPRIPATTRAMGASPPRESLSPAMLARRERQRVVMVKALTGAGRPARERETAPRGGFSFDALDRAIARCGVGRFAFEKSGSGLLIGAVRLAGARTLGTRFLDPFAGDVSSMMPDLDRHARSILSRTPGGNSMLLATIGADAEDLELGEHELPLAAWPIDPVALEEIMFGRVVVVTMFNPAHVWDALRDRGYEVSLDAGGRFRSASLQEGGQERRLENIGWMAALIPRMLMTETNVVAMIDAMVDKAIRKTGEHKGGNVKVEIIPRLFR